MPLLAKGGIMKSPIGEMRYPEIGDTVVCIDATASFHRLVKGGKYTVEAAYDGSPVVIVNGAYHCVERFKKTRRKTNETES